MTQDESQDERQADMESYITKPIGFTWRSHTLFALFTIGIGMFTDIFLYGLVVPILPFILEDHIGIPEDQHQLFVSELLSSFAIASVVFSPFAGALTDKARTRRMPFLGGLLALFVSTVLLFTARTIPLLTLARILQGASTALVWTVGLAMCRDTVGAENLGTTIGTILGIACAATVIAPVAGGILYSSFGISSVAALALSLLAIDFVMRLLVIERRVADRYHRAEQYSEDVSNGVINAGQVGEETSLLPERPVHEDEDIYRIPKDQPYIIREVPILYCFSSPSVSLALFLMLFQGIILGSFDATIPLHARALFDFNSMQSGSLFAPIGICNVIAGPIAGWVTDRFGTRPVATIAYALFVPALALLRLPQSEPRTEEIALYASILGIAGIALGMADSPPIVEAGLAIEKFHKQNPDFFGPNGPYAQLYGLSNMMISLGLTLGPVIAGALRLRIGYGNMNAVLAVFSAVVSLLSFMYFSKKQGK